MSKEVPLDGGYINPDKLPVLEFDFISLCLVSVLCIYILPRACTYFYKLLKLMGIISVSGIYAVVASVVVMFMKKSDWVAKQIEVANSALLACGFPAYIQVDMGIAYNALNEWVSRL